MLLLARLTGRWSSRHSGSASARMKPQLWRASQRGMLPCRSPVFFFAAVCCSPEIASWRDSGKTGWVDGWLAGLWCVHWQSRLRWSLDGSIAVIDVTDARVSEASIFILLPLGGALTNGHWSCYGDWWLDSVYVVIQTARLQAAVYKYCLCLLHCDSWVVCLSVCGRFPHCVGQFQI
jgi:hypothetical protein